ncbi:MAG: outer membrane beta-barrel protein [Vicingaceae bacterium]
MKKLVALSLSLLLALPFIMAQEVVVKSDTTEQDTVRITTKKKKIIIVAREDYEADSDGDEKDTTKISHLSKQRWNHFAGIDLGVNGFMSPENSVDLQKEAQFMDLNYSKSISLSINFMEYYIPIAKEKLGLMTGLGFEFNSCDLDRSVTLFADDDTTIGIADPTKDIEKNRFKSTMLNLPLMLETNIGKDAGHSFHLAAGVMGSMRVGSKTKQIYDQSDKEYKVKNRTDFNMSPFRLNAVARIGYGDFTLFASYSLTPMFDKDKGPELYPFTVGISLVSF